jgi:hypothetical protein
MVTRELRKPAAGYAMSQAQRRIGNDMSVDERQMSFFIHLWRENGERPTWRGRVNDGEGGHSLAFEDEQALLGFIRGRLLKESIALPKRRAES